MLCKFQKEYTFYDIKQLLDIDFNRKPQMFTNKPLLAATLPATLSALFASPSWIISQSTLGPDNTFIYLMQLSGIWHVLAVYIQPSRLIFVAYMQPLKAISTVYIQPFGILLI